MMSIAVTAVSLIISGFCRRYFWQNLQTIRKRTYFWTNFYFFCENLWNRQ